MSIRITIIHKHYKKKVDFLFKAIRNSIYSTLIGTPITQCRIDVEIKSKKDINVLRELLGDLEIWMEK